jgi:hypothetical protein
MIILCTAFHTAPLGFRSGLEKRSAEALEPLEGGFVSSRRTRVRLHDLLANRKTQSKHEMNEQS